MATALKLTLYGSMLGGIGGGTGTRQGGEEAAAIALSQVGQVGGYPYWSWYGFSSRVEWCACFVSWCYAQVGLSEPGFPGAPQGAWPGSNPTTSGRTGNAPTSLRGRHLLRLGWFRQRRPCGHCGGCGRNRVYTVEGNSGNDACNYKSYLRGSSVIRGYGLMLWP